MMEILIITGMSGSGKSQALNALEDMGYFCMDNLPPALLPKFCEMAISSKSQDKVAVVLDLRSGKFFENFMGTLNQLKEMDINYKILFLDAHIDVIIARYKELRRPHPLNRSIVDGYEYEQKTLAPIKRIADFVIDTGDFTNRDLKRYISSIIHDKNSTKMAIVITSFGYKKGILKDADLIFDVRFLPNPYYEEELKNLDGLKKKTRDFVLNKEVSAIFLEKLMDLLEFLIPHYRDEGKNMISIGFGCTGGFHRSVAISEEVGKRLKKMGYFSYVLHRDREARLWK